MALISYTRLSYVFWVRCYDICASTSSYHFGVESKSLDKEATPVQIGFALRCVIRYDSSRGVLIELDRETIKKHRSDALKKNHKIRNKFKADALEDFIRKVCGKQTPQVCYPTYSTGTYSMPTLQIAALDKKVRWGKYALRLSANTCLQTLRHPLRF